MIEVSTRRTYSNDKEDTERENHTSQSQKNTLSKKKTLGGSGKTLKPYSK